MKKIHYFGCLFFCLLISSCLLEDLFDECNHHRSFLEEPITTTELSIECICDDSNLFLSEQLLPYTSIQNFQFLCEVETFFNDIPTIDSVTALSSYVITENITTAFPNLQTFNSYEFRSISNTNFLANLPRLTNLYLANVVDLSNELNNLPLENFSLIINDTIESIPTNINDFDKLTSLSITANLEEIPNDLTNLTNLEFLQINGQNLDLTNLSGFPNVKEMIISGNNFTIPTTNVFANLDALNTLQLYGNIPLSFQTEIFKMNNLKFLQFYGDNELSDAIGMLQSLEHLRLSVKAIPPTIVNLINLKTLYIQNLAEFPDAILGLANQSNLESLALPAGEIRSIPAEIGNFTSIKTLSFNSNRLTSLPSEIQNLATTLETLNLGNNKFSGTAQQEIRDWLPNTIINF